MDEQLLTAEKLAERLDLSVTKVRTLYRSGKIPRLKLGYRAVRFYWPDVLAALKASNDRKLKEIIDRQPELPLES